MFSAEVLISRGIIHTRKSEVLIKLKRLLASLTAAIVVSAAAAMSASAYSSTVAGITVNYSSTINATYAMSSSSIAADPTTNTLKAKISANYVYRNTTTGVSETDYDSAGYSEGGCGLQYRAPTGCEMKSVGATHSFIINSVTKSFTSAASR